MVTCIVLLGPPASGKSTVGAALGALGYRWREWEPVLIERWGSRENFIANKERALREHQGDLAAFITEPGPPAVLETTGISDAPFLDILTRAADVFVVRLDVALDEALRRIAARPAGQHLTDELERNRATWQAFQDLVVPHRKSNLVIDTVTLDPIGAARRIHQEFSLQAG